MRWRKEAKETYLSNSRSSGWPARTKVMEFLVSKAKLTMFLMAVRAVAARS